METLVSMQNALIALCGTLLVALIAFYQWRKRASLDSASAIALSRKSAIEKLWQKAEQISIDLRNGDELSNVVDNQIKQFNELFLIESLYLQDSDQLLFTDYIHVLSKFKRVIYSSGNQDAVSRFADTAAFLDPSGDPEIDAASKEVAISREKIRALVISSHTS